MISLAVYAVAVLADLWTTDRALKRHPNAMETHPIMSKLFGGRPSRSQFALFALAQTSVWVGAAIWFDAPPEILLVPAAFHLYAAQANYRAEKRQ